MSPRNRISFAVALALAITSPHAAHALGDWTPVMPGGWADRLVPSQLPVAADGSSVPGPTTLGGNSSCFASAAYGNVGGTVTLVPSTLELRFDGAPFHAAPILPMSPGASARVVNVPFASPAGVHTLGMKLDPAQLEPEGDRSNNAYARQWFFTPDAEISNSGLVRPQAPDPTGGWADLPASVTPVRNSDVVRVQPGSFTGDEGVWQVVAVHGAASGPQLGLYLTDDDERPELALRAPLVVSAQDWLGTTNYVVINHRAVPPLPVLAFIDRITGSGPTEVEARLSSLAPVAVGGPASEHTLAAEQRVAVHELTVAASEAGWVRVGLTQPYGPQQALQLEVFDTSVGRARRGDAVASTYSRRAGTAWVDVPVPVAGHYGIVVVRDAADGPALACRYLLEVTRARADLDIVAHGAWTDVLEIGADAQISSPLADPREGLPAWMGATVWNYGHATFPASQSALGLRIDGVMTAVLRGVDVPPSSEATLSLPLPTTLSGRHTLTAVANPDGLPENFVANNTKARQVVWHSNPMPARTLVLRNPPPPATGGWNDLPAGDVRFLNADGVRSPDFSYVASPDSGSWGAVAMMATDAADDFDLDVFERADGIASGFAQPLRTSSEAAGRIEIAFMDQLSSWSDTRVDLGIRSVHGTSHSAIEADGSRTVASGFTQPVLGMLTSNMLFQVFDVAPGPAGPMRVVLEPLSPLADLGIAVIARDRRPDGVYTLSEARAASRLADTHGRAEPETLSFAMPADYYAVVVFRGGPTEVGTQVPFRVHAIGPSTLAVGDGPGAPSELLLAAPAPNPVRGHGTFRFALPAAGNAELALFDAAGRRVRTLASGPHDAGEHRVAWNGTDDNGARLASGLYFVRLDADGRRRSEKLALVE